MIKIEFAIPDVLDEGEITWEVNGDFRELIGITCSIGKTIVADVENMPGLSMRSKMLLSAIAGAVFQRLYDEDYILSDIMSGTFHITMTDDIKADGDPTKIKAEDMRSRLIELMCLSMRCTTKLAELMTECCPKYMWKDIVKIGDRLFVEKFPISGEMDGDTHYRIDEFIEAVANKYSVPIDSVKTYMMDGITVDSAMLQIAIEECGCYINGIPEWNIPEDHTTSTSEERGE